MRMKMDYGPMTLEKVRQMRQEAGMVLAWLASEDDLGKRRNDPEWVFVERRRQREEALDRLEAATEALAVLGETEVAR